MDLIAEFQFMINERFNRFVEVICEGYDGIDADYLRQVWADTCAEKIDYYGEEDEEGSGCCSDSEPESPVKKAKSPVKKSPPKKAVSSDSESSDSEPESPVKKAKSPVKATSPKQCEYVFKSGPNKGEQCETKCKEGSLCGKHKGKSEEEPKTKGAEPKSAKKPEPKKSEEEPKTTVAEPKSVKKPEPKTKGAEPKTKGAEPKTVKKPVESDEDSDSDSEPVTVPKQIAIRLNKTIGKYWHEATALVFRSASERVVIGRLVGSKVVNLRPDDISNCKDQGFKYDPACVAEDVDEEPKSEPKSAHKSPLAKTSLLSKIGKLGEKKDDKKISFQALAKKDEKEEIEEEDDAVEDIEDVLDEIQEEDDE